MGTTACTPIKPLVPYHGSKGRLAPWITSLLPPHRVYVEPFAGSAAVLLAKGPSTHEILNDLDGNVVNFYRMLRERPDDLEYACRLTPYARDEFDAATFDEDLDDLERARRWWIRTNQSFVHTGSEDTGWSTSITRGWWSSGKAGRRQRRRRSARSGSNNARTVFNRSMMYRASRERLSLVTIEALRRSRWRDLPGPAKASGDPVPNSWA